MPRKSSLKLPALDLGEETVGERIARLRKERGYTQIELAERIGADSGADLGLRTRQAEIERRDGRQVRAGSGSLDR